MDNKQFLIYLVIMAGVTYLTRALPFALISKKIENRFIKSFLHYIPYTVLTVMTVPGVLFATGSVLSAAVGAVVAIVVAIKSKNLMITAVAACACVFIVETAVTLI